MQNENLENQNTKKAGQVRPNPSRNNKTIKQGTNNDNEKRFSSENDSNRDVEIDTGSQTNGTEIDLDRSGVNTSEDSGTRSFSAGAQGDGVKNAPSASGQQEQQQAQQQTGTSGESSGSVNDDAMKAGAGASYDANAQFDDDEDYGSHVGDDEEIQKAGGGNIADVQGEDTANKNRQSGTAPGSNMGLNQNANRGAQQGGQFNQNQDDSRRQ